MSDIHDLLETLSNDDKQSSSSGRENKAGGGITPLDIAGLPDPQKKMLFFMLRDKKAASKGLSLQELKSMFSDEQFNDMIQELIAENWLVVNRNGHYKLNLGRSRRRLSGNDLWKAISTD